MGPYAIFVLTCLICASLAGFATSNRLYAPAAALLLSAAFARLAEWGPIEPHRVMVVGCAVCMLVAVQGGDRLSRAIVSVYALRLAIFIVPGVSNIYAASIMWELSNALVLLQAALLAGGVLHDRTNGLGSRDRSYARNIIRGLVDDTPWRPLERLAGRNG